MDTQKEIESLVNDLKLAVGVAVIRYKRVEGTLTTHYYIEIQVTKTKQEYADAI